ncbi:MAG: hypothetical protein Q8P97_01535 [bacterium]|nr:hypothetical protein [bacterium]
MLCTLTVTAFPMANAEQGKIMTDGNFSYIEVQRYGNPDSMQHVILGLLSKFEKDHSNLRVISYSIEKQQYAYLSSAYVSGIWVTHESRK